MGAHGPPVTRTRVDIEGREHAPPTRSQPAGVLHHLKAPAVRLHTAHLAPQQADHAPVALAGDPSLGKDGWILQREITPVGELDVGAGHEAVHRGQHDGGPLAAIVPDPHGTLKLPVLMAGVGQRRLQPQHAIGRQAQLMFHHGIREVREPAAQDDGQRAVVALDRCVVTHARLCEPVERRAGQHESAGQVRAGQGVFQVVASLA